MKSSEEIVKDLLIWHGFDAMQYPELVYDFAQALTQQREEGRKEGLENAAIIVSNIYAEDQLISHSEAALIKEIMSRLRNLQAEKSQPEADKKEG